MDSVAGGFGVFNRRAGGREGEMEGSKFRTESVDDSAELPL